MKEARGRVKSERRGLRERGRGFLCVCETERKRRREIHFYTRSQPSAKSEGCYLHEF